MGLQKGEIDLYGFLDHLQEMPIQMAFLTSQARHAALIGGVGSGKTVALCAIALLNGIDEPNGFSLIGRLNMTALKKSTFKTFLEMVPEEWVEDWNKTDKKIVLRNGHEFDFTHLDIGEPEVAAHIKSMNLSAVYVDEGSEISEETYYLLLSRLRRKNCKRHIARISSNPAGQDWQWRLFFDPNRAPEIQQSHVGMTITTDDNIFLDEEYKQTLKAVYPKDWMDRYYYGKFTDFSDLVYKEFAEWSHGWELGKSYKIFDGRDTPPYSWPVIVGMDIGSDIDPWAIPIIAVAPDARLYQYEEVYGRSMLIKDIAGEVQAKIGGRHVLGVAYDYANRQAALELAEEGIYGGAAIKEVRPGLFKCGQYMHIDPRLEHPFDQKIEGSPWYFVSSVCTNTIRELSAYKWAKDRAGKPTGEPSHDNSHSPDGIRYAIHTFRPAPDKISLPRKSDNPDLNVHSRAYWAAEEARADRMNNFKPGKGQLKTYQQWMKEAQKSPARFQRSKSLRFTRFGR